ncbi:hypothetical protein TGME49_212030 [Toxoplasma gondii ME49]|uniref:Uncharacterized protein n=1 Tax=Toxoplasma gondii (strain ATCC 50611 / Me49) TaxID=508771 RepID=S8G5C6_TOXGM|nr:hypothetical protein TGME49_212030 [Toxoplasma gondii ME49]EPT26820.1 hypothetical protein TGME49_212030 [Toxoplasma gondii ME49]|eukprot:XP_002371805.2 hypothetical protein TGME49_212030 [Toxoplasma gondii ME49]
MILDKKPLLLKAFALKALLLKPELLIQPDLLFRSGLLFKPGLLPGMGDLELKKLLLAAVLAPKVIAGLKPMFGASLWNIPLLLIEKLVTLDPGQLLMLLSSLSGGGLDGLLGAMGTDELKAQGAEAASWESVNSEGEPDITAAGAEEDARSLIIRFAREVGRQEGAEEEYASRAAEFVDQFLSPTGLTQEVARMMMTARQAVGNDIEGIEGNRAATDSDFLDGDMGGLLSLLGDLEALIESKIACVALGKAFFKYVLVPLQLAGPVASMILDKKPLLLKAFALKALLLKPELLIQPDLLFRSGLLFKPGLLPGMGDLELKKLVLDAVLVCILVDGVTMVGNSGGMSQFVRRVPGLTVFELLALLASDRRALGAIVSLCANSVGIQGSGPQQLLGTYEERLHALKSAAKNAGQHLSEEEAEARFQIVRFAGEVGSFRGAPEEYVRIASAFVDRFLAPAGLLNEVAQLIRQARKETPESDAVASNKTSFDQKLFVGGTIVS